MVICNKKSIQFCKKKNVIFSFKVVTFLAPLVALNNTPISGCKWVGGLIVVLN